MPIGTAMLTPLNFSPDAPGPNRATILPCTGQAKPLVSAAGIDPVRMGVLSEIWVGYPEGEYSGTRAWPQEVRA